MLTWIYVYFLFFCLFVISRATFVAYGGSQARGRIEAVAASLCHSHSSVGSELSLTHTPAHGNTRSLTHWVRPEIEPATSWFLVRFISTVPQWRLQIFSSERQWKKFKYDVLQINVNKSCYNAITPLKKQNPYKLVIEVISINLVLRKIIFKRYTLDWSYLYTLQFNILIFTASEKASVFQKGSSRDEKWRTSSLLKLNYSIFSQHNCSILKISRFTRLVEKNKVVF